jgi:mono/diheme cytochrome c family protein
MTMRWAVLCVAILLSAGPSKGATIGIAPVPAEPETPVDESRFPPGPERQFILDTCQGCHTLNLVARSGADIDGWTDRLVRMIRAGAPVTRNQIPALAAYLAKAFPVRPKPQISPYR